MRRGKREGLYLQEEVLRLTGRVCACVRFEGRRARACVREGVG